MYGKPAITCFKYQAFLYGSEAITYLNAVSHPWFEHFYQLLSSRYNTEKGGGKGKRYWIDNRTRLTAVQPGATWTLKACARRGALTRAPPPFPPPTHTPPTGL
jgi:hypothetical protein